ncbi:MAG: methyltransferase domain-containing protein [Bacillota bacterium]
MQDWDARLYLKYADERTRPAVDLAARITVERPQRIADIGCGPGNSTVILAQKFPKAYVLGIDNSPKMIRTAQSDYPELDFVVCDAAVDLPSLGGGFDVVFSNACLQWVPDHEKVLGQMMEMLSPGGFLAVQMPYNQDEPVKKIINEIAASPAWEEYFDNLHPFYTRTAKEYYDILRPYASTVTLWETVYYHVLNSHEDILEWYRGTGLRPYLNRLPDDKKAVFENDILWRVKQSYPEQADGRVLFRFPRLFFTAPK